MILATKKTDDAKNILPEKLIGYDPLITSHIMSYLAPKDLLNAANCNKLMKNNLTMKMVVQSILNTGGTPMASMIALYPHMKSRAIHSMSPYRMLDVCTGTQCEYCQYVTDEPTPTRKTLQVRKNFAIKACWDCITKPKKRSSIYSPAIQTCYALTTRVNKIDYNTSNERYGINVWYEDNRDLLFKIWNHDKVLAYPAGKRWFTERNDGTMLPVANEIEGNVQSLDRFEIMYTQTEKDKFGNHYGPRLTASNLPDLVRYIKTATGRSINRHIDYFIENILANQSTPQSYQPFLQNYNKYIKAAKVNEDMRKKLFIGTKFLRVYNKVDKSMKAIHRIASCMSRNNIRLWTTLRHLHTEHDYFMAEKKKCNDFCCFTLKSHT